MSDDDDDENLVLSQRSQNIIKPYQ